MSCTPTTDPRTALEALYRLKALHDEKSKPKR